jgi:hypothetical protein
MDVSARRSHRNMEKIRRRKENNRREQRCCGKFLVFSYFFMISPS